MKPDRTGAAPVRVAVLLLALVVAGAAGWALGRAGGRSAGPGGAATEAGPGSATMDARSAASLEDLGPAPHYTLTDQNGRRVDSDSLLGKVRVVTFLFPYCRTYCPLVAAHLRGLQSELESAGLADRVQTVAFNVDPAGADRTRMRSFLRQYGWEPSGRAMEYLTGTPTEIRRVVTGGYHVDYRRVEEGGEGPGGAGAAGDTTGALAPQPEVLNPLADSAAVTYDVVHNDALELVDPQGRIRRYYGEADRVSDERLVSDIRALLGGGER
ncbi:MAG: SCO family protein [Candidatus Palauibacterales bacterium]|nr:SCO family protein [Candidatus Palauibacterales bacterium]MDP2530594.1 SCO family protein [Candidatus Palauibacterales bacterium]MDP2583607.1 SCO family protein [Candidatus Palauibacterales bacterium]